MSNSFINYDEFNESWQIINTFSKMVSVFPADNSTFEQKYGAFNYPMPVLEFIKSCNTLNEQIELLGGSKKLKQEIANNPDYLTGSLPLDGSIYDSIVWLTAQTSQIANSFILVLSDLKSTLDPSSGSNNQRAKRLTDILCGTSGLSFSVNSLKTHISKIISDINSIEQKYISAFVSVSDTKLLADANENIGLLTAQNKKNTSRIDELNASLNPFGKDERAKEISFLTQQIRSNIDEINKKRTFTSDLDTQFMLTGNKLNTTLSKIRINLNNIQSYFSGISDQLHSITENSSIDQLSSYDWIAKALDVSSLTTTWNDTKKAADLFVQNSMVN